jgi:hypothetical protein
MKAVSTRMLGMSGALSTAKPACSTCACAAAPPADARQHLAAELQAVLDLRRGAHVQHGAQQLRVAHAGHVDAAHLVGGVLARRHPARRALLAPLADSANTLAPRASGRMKKASACRLTNRSACTRRALRTRSCSGTK